MLKAICLMSAMSMLAILPFTGSADSQIAPGVQQSAAQTATITGTVLQSDGMPVVGAEVQLNGPGAHLLTKSDAHGIFDFMGVPYGSYRIVTIAANFGTTSRDEVIVKGDLNVSIQYVPGTSAGLKTIAHVSTQSAGMKINVTPASIASINPSDYAFQGNSSWQHLLNQIPGVTVGGALGGGLNGNAPNVVPGAPLAPVLLSINGALPYETSTTLDGMPLYNTSFATTDFGGADLSYLPMPAFDTADVVRGPGADSPSIVDSIGGSFVLHAPGRVDKNQFEFSASNDPYGGIVANVKAALRFGKLSATIVYGVNDSPGPVGLQNVIPAVTENIQTISGQTFFSGGFTGNIPNPNYQSCYCGFQDTLLYCCAPVNTEWSQHNGSLALSYDITPSITAQVFYAGSSSDMQGPDLLIPTLFSPGAGYSGNIAPGLHTYYATTGAIPDVQSASLLEEKITAFIGRGVLRLAALQNNSFEQQSAPNAHPDGQYTLYGTACIGAGVDPGCPFGGIPTTYNGTPESVTFVPYHLLYSVWVNSRDILASYATPVGSKSSLGISYVTSYYNGPDIIDEVYNGFVCPTLDVPPGVSQTTSELRLHAGTELSDKLSIDASWYFAKGLYHVQSPSDSTGNTYTNVSFPYSAPRLGMVWRVSRDAVVRAAAGGGYALPVLSSIGAGSGFIFLVGPYYYEFQRNLDLKPEKSFGFDLGTDMRLHHDTVLSFDLYRTNLYGQFFISTSLEGTHLGLPLYVNETRNLSESRYEGINIDIRHDVPTGIYWHGALGLTHAYVVGVEPGFYNQPFCTNCVNTYIVPGVNFDGKFQSTVPYANGAALIGYRWSPGKYVDLSPMYYGNNNPYFEPAFLEFDAHAGYPLTKNVSLSATFRNITGIYGQNYQLLAPSMGAPSVAGLPYALYGLPYGPRSVIVTASFKY